MEDYIAIYKGLRLPILSVTLIIMSLYIFWPSRKREVEQAKYNMLDDDLDPDLSQKILEREANS